MKIIIVGAGRVGTSVAEACAVRKKRATANTVPSTLPPAGTGHANRGT